MRARLSTGRRQSCAILCARAPLGASAGVGRMAYCLLPVAEVGLERQSPARATDLARGRAAATRSQDGESGTARRRFGAVSPGWASPPGVGHGCPGRVGGVHHPVPGAGVRSTTHSGHTCPFSCSGLWRQVNRELQHDFTDPSPKPGPTKGARQSSAGRRPKQISRSHASSSSSSRFRFLEANGSQLPDLPSVKRCTPSGAAAALPLPPTVARSGGLLQWAWRQGGCNRSWAICLARVFGSHWRSMVARSSASSHCLLPRR